MSIEISSRGNFSKTYTFLNRGYAWIFSKVLDHYGAVGVEALENATPKRSGKTASSWSYEVIRNKNQVSITWTNSNENKGIPIVVLIQYGHGMPNGTYVEGIDFINPAMRPVFEQIADSIWKEVVKS